MEMQEWVIRTLIALLVVNVFVFGLYTFLRGYFMQYVLRRFWIKKPGLLTRARNFRSSVEWRHRGEIINAIDPSLFTIRKKQKISIFVSPDGYDFRVNTWTKNGFSLLGAGVLLMASAVIVFWTGMIFS